MDFSIPFEGEDNLPVKNHKSDISAKNIEKQKNQNSKSAVNYLLVPDDKKNKIPKIKKLNISKNSDKTRKKQKIKRGRRIKDLIIPANSEVDQSLKNYEQNQPLKKQKFIISKKKN